ncbi:glutathione S-transferase [Clavulina sp. PMI_390]|nr:glutathione S-transferase [Clavulina sp. PMI_390]
MSRHLLQPTSRAARAILSSRTSLNIHHSFSTSIRLLGPEFTLYTARTPNGFKASLIFEELRAAYPNKTLDYKVRKMDTDNMEQKESWYLKINPNGRIPAIVHHRADGSNFPVFESAAIMLYLTQHLDPDHILSFPVGSDHYSEMLQWIFFAHGGLGPMQGQAMHFYDLKDPIPYATKRYHDETGRLFSVLESRLKGRDWLVGSDRGKYSLADLNAWTWVRRHHRVGFETLDDFPNLKQWMETIQERPTAKLAITIPPE